MQSKSKAAANSAKTARSEEKGAECVEKKTCRKTESAMTKNNHNIQHSVQFSSVYLFSGVRLLVTPQTAACQAGLLVHRQLLEFTQTQLY